MITLPNKPSELILLGLRDLEAVEAMPKNRYRVYMDPFWVYRPKDSTFCVVCFAGAVMVCTLGASVLRERELDPYDFPAHTKKLMALNCARFGNWQIMAQNLGIDIIVPAKLERLEPNDYRDSPVKFKRDMRKAASIFAKAGM